MHEFLTKQELFERRLDIALEASGLDLWENDLSTGEVVFGLTKVFYQLGYTQQDVVAYVDDIYALMHPDDIAAVKLAVERHIDGQTLRYYSEFRLRNQTGEWVWFANYGKIVDRDDHHGCNRFTGVCFSLEEQMRYKEELNALNARLAAQNEQLEKMNQKLHRLANYDPLTNTVNRRRLMELGEEEVERARHFGEPLSFLLIDIDFFKIINDTWGHLAGDQAIRAVAQRCEEELKDHIATLGRFGGEEFTVLLPSLPQAEAEVLANQICNFIDKEGVWLAEIGQIIPVTVSIGVAELSCIGRGGFSELIDAADKALYEAKRSGRNRVCRAPKMPLTSTFTAL
ncbi:sensor domain-containing diguanylate cyclase [Vreelandella salicampi]|uniref:diguanylate cyclase n=1 Tax=Vreelandella salicampi TaxID=1449798 RepID=A0A7Z0LIK1_9GAMM|nr:sensor domain-containing diguanylate cyclase [Halomonas salicampi]NYS59553.1 sensor domain-containing diguanylate cyclase [Halomonas salicampi]